MKRALLALVLTTLVGSCAQSCDPTRCITSVGGGILYHEEARR